MAYYNMTNITTADNILVMVQETNKLANYMIGFLILIAIFVILFIAFKNFGVRTTMPITFFLTTILAYFLGTLQLLPDWLMIVLFIATAGFIIASIFMNPEGG